MKTLIILLVLLTSCAALEPNCESRGVMTEGNTGYMGPVLKVHKPFFHKPMIQACFEPIFKKYPAIPRNDYLYPIGGCVVPVDGGVELWVGGTPSFKCVEDHERCHAKYGTKHTERYRVFATLYPADFCHDKPQQNYYPVYRPVLWSN